MIQTRTNRRTAALRLRGLLIVALVLFLLTAAVADPVAARNGPSVEFPGSDTGEANSEQGRENAADRGNGQGTPPGTGDSDGPPTPPGTDAGNS